MEVKNNLIELEVVYSKLNKQIDENISKLQAGAVAVDNYNKKISVVPSEFQKSLTDIKAKTDAITQSNKQLEASERKLQQERIKELQLQKQREQAIDKYNAKQQRELDLLKKQSGLYSQAQQKVRELSEIYNHLAIKKEFGHKLTLKEEASLKKVTNEINIYQSALKKVDSQIQNHTRNVGNYGSTWNGLGNSINQLSREMPAFANSVQTGFMAISNNLPTFFDEITKIKNANKELIAQGQPYKSTFAQIAGALFSVQTALSVGVTLLTVYGAKIWDSISGAKEKKKAIEAEKKAIEDKQKAEEEAIRTTANFSSDEIARSKRLFENAKNLSLSYKERKDAIVELRNRYPEYLKGLTDEQILAGNAANAENELNSALIKRGFALAAQQQLQENISKELQLRIKNSKNNLQVLKDEQEALKFGANEIVIYTDKKKQAEQQNAAIQKKSRKEQYDAYVQNVLALRDERQAILAVYNENAKYIGVVNESSDATKKNTKAKKENEILTIGSEKWLNNQISQLKELNSTLSTTSEEYQVGVGAIKFYEAWLERLTGTAKKAKEELDGVSLDLGGSEFITDEDGDALMKAGNELRALLKEFKQGFIDDFANQSGFSQTLDLLQGGLDKFEGDAVATALAVSEAFQESFNTIAQASQANFDAEYARLEQQRDFAIEMAGGSATAREEIERQYEERKRQIQRREAEAQKRLALFNIAINTAQGVISALAMTPPNVPLSIAIGVIGAVQAGLVASQEIPQFWKGTDNAPEGWAYTQEKGAEVITDKSGNVKTLGSNKGAQLTYLSKGDKVYKSHEDYINKVLSKNGVEPLGSYLNIPMPQNNSFDMQEMKQEFSKLANVIKNKEGVNISIDERGFRKAQGSTEFLNARMNLKSRVI
jgi:hypothetical protein